MVAHKTANKPLLALVFVVNVCAFFALTQASSLTAMNWQLMLHSLGRSVPAAIAVVVIGVINSQLSSEAKACIVFFKLKDPLPGYEAFTRYAKEDSRIDLKALRAVVGPFPTKPAEQNALWYGLLKSIDGDPSVAHIHREFLFNRDYSCLSSLFLVVFGVSGFIVLDARMAAIYLAILGIQFGLATRAARVQASRLVTTVLALKAAGR